MATSPEFLPLLQCSICLEVYNTPRTLPCAHTFCLRCLEQLAQQTSLRCAVCRKTHRVPASGVKDFPPNPVVMGLLDKLCTGCLKNTVGGGRFNQQYGTHARTNKYTLKIQRNTLTHVKTYPAPILLIQALLLKIRSHLDFMGIHRG